MAPFLFLRVFRMVYFFPIMTDAALTIIFIQTWVLVWGSLLIGFFTLAMWIFQLTQKMLNLIDNGHFK